MAQKSLFIGGKIKKMRRDRNINQKTLADSLGISASYLNLIERNRRGLTVTLLLKLAELFEVDIKELNKQSDVHIVSDLMELFGDGLFSDFDLTNKDIEDLAIENPEIGKAFIRLYDNYKSNAENASDFKSAKAPTGISPSGAEKISVQMSDQISDFLQNHNNFFPSLEIAAERIRSEIETINEGLFQNLKTFASNAFGLKTSFDDLPDNKPYIYSAIENTLKLSKKIDAETCTFQLARFVGLLAAEQEIDTIIEDADFEDESVGGHLKPVLCRYIAASIMMPYDEMLKLAKLHRYDIDVLCRQFKASFEQVCHRLTTLNKPGSKGIPFHFVRTDIAGNISKRYSNSGIQIPRYGGACPRWNIFTAFMQPGRINVQLSEMPDGQVYFCIARSITKGSGRFGEPMRHFSIGLGCKYIHAKSLVYSDAIGLKNASQVIPVGVSCRICPREACSERAYPYSIS